MKFIKSIGVKVLAATLAFTFVPAIAPSGTPLVGVTQAEAQYRFDGQRGRYYRHGGRHWDGGHRFGGRPGYYGHRRYGRDYGNRRYGRDYGNGRYWRHRDNNSAIAAGIIGLGVGAAIASSARPRYAAPAYRGGLSAHDRYCLSRYRSYDPASGTYQPYNGPRRLCR